MKNRSIFIFSTIFLLLLTGLIIFKKAEVKKREKKKIITKIIFKKNGKILGHDYLPSQGDKITVICYLKYSDGSAFHGFNKSKKVIFELHGTKYEDPPLEFKWEKSKGNSISAILKPGKNKLEAPEKLISTSYFGVVSVIV